MRTKDNGLTITELLAALAALAVIFLLLVPAINTVREKRNRTCCAANLGRIGVALNGYIHDHQGRLPSVYHGDHGVTWDQALINGGYLDAHSLHCPSDRIARASGTKPRTYALSAGRDMHQMPYWLRAETNRAAVFANRTDIALVGERPWGNGPSVVGGVGGMLCDKKWLFSAHFWTGTPENYSTYIKTSNYLFFDGHVEWVNNPTDERLNVMFPSP